MVVTNGQETSGYPIYCGLVHSIAWLRTHWFNIMATNVNQERTEQMEAQFRCYNGYQRTPPWMEVDRPMWEESIGAGESCM